MDRWALIQGFGKGEKWGNPDKMDFFLLMLMEKVRAAFKAEFDPDAKFHIHCGYETTGHAPRSEHGNGTATDFHIETKLSFEVQVVAMLKILADFGVTGKVGLGIYPEWAHPGFHLDTRGSMARWGWLGGVMVAFDKALDAVRERKL